MRADREVEIDLAASAGETFGSAPEGETWWLVREPASIPVAAGGAKNAGAPAPPFPPPKNGETLPVARLALEASDGEAVHTLRELESAVFERPAPGRPPAVMFRPQAVPALAGETVGAYFDRVTARSAGQGSRLDGSGTPFGAVVLEDPSELERPELSSRVPSGCRRLLDAGCGGGATSAALRGRHPGLAVTGLEKDPNAAARARTRLDRVLEGDVASLLRDLASAGERFDAFLFGDVLEHLSDPVAALDAARAAAESGAVLVASVPNAGHLSVVRDLVLGRFDAVPAGLLDAGHLRWFTAGFLTEALEEAGWAVNSLEGLTGAPPPDPEPFLSALGDWPGMDRVSLSTYQWVAVASASVRA